MILNPALSHSREREKKWHVLPVDADTSKQMRRPWCHLGNDLDFCTFKINGRIELLNPDRSWNLAMLHGQNRLHDLGHGARSFTVSEVWLDL